MLKLLIVDDEPLVQVGVKSMIDWNQFDVEICGTAKNGEAAFEIISDLRPEIVITDIHMPKMNGLELMAKCREEFGDLPIFILLTSYEDFQYARQAINYQAADYLIKLELNEEILISSIDRAKKQLFSNTGIESKEKEGNISIFHERFYIRLLNNLFEDKHEFEVQKQASNISIDAAGYVCALMEIKLNHMSPGQQLNLYNNTVLMYQNVISRFAPCKVIPLDIRYFVIIFFLDEQHKADKRYVEHALMHSNQMLFNYYSVTIFCGVGRFVTELLDVSLSYHDSKQLTSYLTEDTNLVFIDDVPVKEHLQNVFNLSLFRKDIHKAFDSYNKESLKEIFQNITDLFHEGRVQFTQALDAAGSILHFTIILLPNGTAIAENIFKNESDNYHSLYRLTSVSQIIMWLKQLECGLLEFFDEQQNNYQNQIVVQVKKYVQAHITERLSLQKVADLSNVSTNYLSQLFKKYNDIGFNEYITQVKIEKAKEMFSNDNMKVYEVADALGYENAFYFSKVFKKVTGVSPKDFSNRP